MIPRHILPSLVLIGGLVSLNGCGAPDGSGNQTGGAQADGWTMAPRVERVQLKGRNATIGGAAAPESRVVLRGDEGENFAVGVDTKGHFELSVELLDDSVILIPEVQQGQDAIKGPERLVILPDAGLAVIQADGRPSQRLTPGPSLDAIDSDGRAFVATGRGKAGDSVAVSVPGIYQTTVKVGDDQRWSTSLAGVSAGGFTLSVGGRTYAYPGTGQALEDTQNQRLDYDNGGWRLTRRVGDRALLTSWFPDL